MLRCLLAALFLFSACAAADDGLTPDQKRMRACNTRAKEKSISGAERSHFMRISGRTRPARGVRTTGGSKAPSGAAS